MARSASALINPNLLCWARSAARMNPHYAATKLGIPEDRLLKWETGDAQPSISQLRDIAKLYRQNFAAFFLPEPPEAFELPTKDFRRLPGTQLFEISPDIVFDIRDSLNKREIALELMQDTLSATQDFRLELNITDQIDSAAHILRDFLGISMEEQSTWKDFRIAFNKWREKLENNDILVFQSTKLNLSEMRGYSICYFPLPLIVVNRKDSHSARIFSMLHELTHLGLRTSGLCNLETREDLPPEDQNLEIFCNAVAGAALVPSDILLDTKEVRGNRSHVWDDDIMKLLSKKFGVSREVILRRLLDLGRTSKDYYQRKRDEYNEEFEARQKRGSGGFVPPSQDVLSARGKTFVSLVFDSLSTNKINANDASDYLGVKIKHFNKIAQLLHH